MALASLPSDHDASVPNSFVFAEGQLAKCEMTLTGLRFSCPSPSFRQVQWPSE